jgi:UDPglucose 6-dehydrogenase
VPLVFTDITTAETIKYASNSFLATKISFVNEVARICERVGADVTEVSAAMGLDPRIGGQFLDAGMGWGGSCFGKDVRALVATAQRYGYRPRILEAALAVNRDQRVLVVDALLQHLKLLAGARLGVLGRLQARDRRHEGLSGGGNLREAGRPRLGGNGLRPDGP